MNGYVHALVRRRTHSCALCTNTNTDCICFREGAQIVDVEESMFEDSEAMLTRVEPYWPQLEMDSMRNLWIVKPGDKSKGIGTQATSEGCLHYHYIDPSI